MYPITKAIHKIVIQSKGEEFFIGLRRRAALLRKFLPIGIRHKFPSFGRLVPHSSEYPRDDSYFLTRDNTNFHINRSDYVQWRLFYGIRDNALKAAKQLLGSDGLVLDVGANFGAFSLKLASYIQQKKISDVTIHAFEPNPLVYRNLKNNLELNSSLARVVHLHDTGLGSENGSVPFIFDQSNTGAGRVVSESGGPISIKLERLDDFIDALKPNKILFIKLIAEGFESEILKGGWRTIEKFRPPLFIEVTRAWWLEHGSHVEEVLDKLSRLGYRFTIEHFNEMIPYEPSKHSSRSQFNILAIGSHQKQQLK